MATHRVWRDEIRRAAYLFGKEKLSIAGVGIIILLVLTAIFGQALVPFPEDSSGALHIDVRLQAPTWDHLFGTDHMGRDILSRVIMGTDLALQTIVIVLTLATLIGTVLGAVAGFNGGLIDDLIMRITDVFLTIPDLILAIAIASILGPGVRNAFLALSLVWWPGYCRLIRGQVLKIRGEDYVVASKSMGARAAWIIRSHILPNALTELLVKMSLDIGYVLLSAAALGFIGLGAQPPTPEWGAMVSEARGYFPTWWWYFAFPGGAIFLSVLAFNLVGDGIARLARG